MKIPHINIYKHLFERKSFQGPNSGKLIFKDFFLRSDRYYVYITGEGFGPKTEYEINKKEFFAIYSPQSEYKLIRILYGNKESNN